MKYETPRLTRLGSLADLTLGASGNAKDVGGQTPRTP